MSGAAANDTVAFETEQLDPLPPEDTGGPGAPGAGGGRGDAVAPARKRRWWLRGLVALLGLAVLAGGAEVALRQIIPTVIADSVREGLGLPEDHRIYIELGGSALLPALTGRVGEVEVTVPSVRLFEDIETTLFARAESMPFDPTRGEIVGGSASATIPASSMDAVVSLATNGLVDTGDVVEGGIEVGRVMSIFGFDVPLMATLGLSVSDGDLLIEPHSISAAGFDLTVDQLRSLLDPTAVSMLDTHTVCVRDQMPAGIELTGIELHTGPLGGSAMISVDLARDVLSNPAMQEPGVC